ncbi:MAG: hypothetical protein ACJAZO_002701 [Myxococcota bacterium]|jgi:hypothetical protein
MSSKSGLLPQALLTALLTDADIRVATAELGPAETDQMDDHALAGARKLAKRWCRAESTDRG